MAEQAFTKTFIERVKKAYPTDKKMHELAESGRDSLEFYLRSNAIRHIKIDEVLQATSLEALQQKALLAKEQQALYEDFVSGKCRLAPDKPDAAEKYGQIDQVQDSQFDPEKLPFQVKDLVATYEKLYNVPPENRVTEWFGDYKMYVFKSHYQGVYPTDIESMYQKALNAIGMSSEEFLSNKDKFIYRGEIKALMTSMMVESPQPEISSVDTENGKPSLDESIKTAKDSLSKRSSDSEQAQQLSHNLQKHKESQGLEL